MWALHASDESLLGRYGLALGLRLGLALELGPALGLGVALEWFGWTPGAPFQRFQNTSYKK